MKEKKKGKRKAGWDFAEHMKKGRIENVKCKKGAQGKLGEDEEIPGYRDRDIRIKTLLKPNSRLEMRTAFSDKIRRWIDQKQ